MLVWTRSCLGSEGWVFPFPCPPNLGTISHEAEAANDSVEKAFSKKKKKKAVWCQTPKNALSASPMLQPLGSVCRAPRGVPAQQGHREEERQSAETWWGSCLLHRHSPHPGNLKSGTRTLAPGANLESLTPSDGHQAQNPLQEGKRQQEDAATSFPTIPVEVIFPPRSCCSSQPSRNGGAIEMGSSPELWSFAPAPALLQNPEEHDRHFNLTSQQML